MRRPGFGRYAFPERERRFLIEALPTGATAPVLIEDRYVTGTTLRLRRMSGSFGVVHKFAQKIRPDQSDPSLVMLANIYLSEGEYDRLSSLPASVLVKTRYRLPSQVVVDEFDRALAGLVLAEAAFESAEEMQAFTPPVHAVCEVTGDDRFSGGRLAPLTAPELAQLLAQVKGTA